MSANAPIDINHLAIHSAMDLYKIENKKECFEKVLVLTQNWFNHMRE